MVEVPDSTTRYIQSDSGKPTKDLFNWMRNISQQLSSIFSGTGGGLFSTGLPCFNVHKDGTPQTIPHATGTEVTWSAEIYDIGNFFTSNAWTPPAGKVFMCVTTVLTVSAAGFQKAPVNLVIQKNGSPFRSFNVYVHSSTFAATSVTNTGAMEDVANGTDTYDVHVSALSNDGSSLTLSGAPAETFFMGHWISP